MDPSQLRQLVRRVAGRALAERGLRADAGERSAGVHVSVTPCEGPDRPGGGSSGTAEPRTRTRGRVVVTANDLGAIPAGGSFDVPLGALVTALAHEEAERRGIRLGHGSGRSVDGRADSALRIAVASDHGGFERKAAVCDFVRELGHVPLDLGTHDEQPVDYPDFACAVADAVASGRAAYGIVLDGAGIGSAMAANKVPGIRAANGWNEASARNAREHNYANVLTLGARMHSTAELRAIVVAFLTTPEGAARHARRVRKIMDIERRPAPRSRGGVA